MVKPNGYILFDTNIYRNIVNTLDAKEIKFEASELKKKEQKIGFKTLFSIIVALELISHLGEKDCEREQCYKALCFMRFHCFEGDLKIISYPFENVLTKFFLEKNFIHFDTYDDVIKLVYFLTDRIDIEDCKKFNIQIDEIRNNQLLFRNNLKEQGEKILNQRGLTWNSFDSKSLRKNKDIKTYNNERLEEYKKGDAFYRLAILLIDETYQTNGLERPEELNKEKIEDYLKTFQAPLQLYHFLCKKIGEAQGMEDPLDERWNTVNDMHLAFNLCDKNYVNTLLITNDELIISCCLKYGLEGRIGRWDEYLTFIN